MNNTVNNHVVESLKNPEPASNECRTISRAGAAL